MVRIASVDTFVLRAEIDVPVRTSFGTMYDRPAVALRLRDADGAEGWGEVWCNFPGCGAEHRGRLVATVLAPLLIGRDVEDPPLEWRRLTEATRILALQSGEAGPFAQAIAGIDIALWDLAGRRAGLPLWRLLAGDEGRDGEARVPVYASGINPECAERLVGAKLHEGYRAFKMKVGFGESTDLGSLRALRALLGPEMALMIDANQGWTVGQALAVLPLLRAFDLGWLEEPLAVDAPAADWARLAQNSPIRLAGGENLRGETEFGAVIDGGALSVVQPDVAKWGGVSGCLAVARRALAAGRVYCPHYLGGGIGLAASAHLLAAAGGDGLLEIDANANPLQAGLWPAMPGIEDGRLALPELPGLGVEPDPQALRRHSAA